MTTPLRPRLSDDDKRVLRWWAEREVSADVGYHEVAPWKILALLDEAEAPPDLRNELHIAWRIWKRLEANGPRPVRLSVWIGSHASAASGSWDA